MDVIKNNVTNTKINVNLFEKVVIVTVDPKGHATNTKTTTANPKDRATNTKTTIAVGATNIKTIIAVGATNAKTVKLKIIVITQNTKRENVKVNIVNTTTFQNT